MNWIWGWVGPRAGLDHVEKWKFVTLPGLGLRPLGLPARSQPLYRLRYPGSSFDFLFWKVVIRSSDQEIPCIFNFNNTPTSPRGEEVPGTHCRLHEAVWAPDCPVTSVKKKFLPLPTTLKFVHFFHANVTLHTQTLDYFNTLKYYLFFIHNHLEAIQTMRLKQNFKIIQDSLQVYMVFTIRREDSWRNVGFHQCCNIINKLYGFYIWYYFIHFLVCFGLCETDSFISIFRCTRNRDNGKLCCN
jgi:hypothetical protein